MMIQKQKTAMALEAQVDITAAAAPSWYEDLDEMAQDDARLQAMVRRVLPRLCRSQQRRLIGL